MDVWEQARAQLDGLPHGAGLNIAFEAVDRHVGHGAGDRVAYRFIAADASVRSITYAELSRLSNRFASILGVLGVQAGETVFSFAGRIPEVYIAALGSLKAGAVFSALFANFGEEPARIRLLKGRGKLLLTTGRLFRRRIAGIRGSLPMLRVLIVGDDVPPDTLAYDRAMEDANSSFHIVATDPEHPSFLHFTSGTAGLPKGALHVHAAAAAHYSTARTVFGLREGDIYWCTADPGWVTGISYGLSAPLLHGVTAIVYEGEFDPAQWYRIIQDHRVTVWYTAPTAIRMLMRAGAKLARSFDLSSLRVVASVGEPLSSGGHSLGPPGSGAGYPRYLVANRNRRHHDRHIGGRGGCSRDDGPAAPRNRGGGGASFRRRHDRAHRGQQQGRRVGAEDRLAINVSRLYRRTGTL